MVKHDRSVGEPKVGLVLTSGGARGAYQAGAVLAISEITRSKALPFTVLSGVSAGSINCAFLASRAGDFTNAARSLYDLWAQIEPSDVFLTDAVTLTRIGLNWMADLSLGGWVGSGRGKSLLITSPLRKLLETNIEMEALIANLHSGLLHGLAVTATNYQTGTAISFFDGNPSIELWFRSTRMSRRELLTVDHLMASSAIPVFFPAVLLGNAYYGDGCVRMNTPLSPAIHLGADRVLAIGVRYFRTDEETLGMNHSLSEVDLQKTEAGHRAPKYPYLADVAGVLLNAMFLDGLEADVERMQRINQTLQMIPPEQRLAHPQKLRNIPVMLLQPSLDLGALVLRELKSFPRTVRHFLRGLGASEESGWDLLSYLAFDSAYTKRLLELGYSDTMAKKEQVIRFIDPKP
jgi:NTE family protein